MRIPGVGAAYDEADGEVAWRDTRVAGVRWCPIHLEASSGGRSGGSGGPADASVLIRMEPGHGYPPHRHVGAEEVLVLSGGYRDARGEHRRGDYVRYPAGSVHAPVALGDPDAPASAENPPCVLFAVAHDGVELVEPTDAEGDGAAR